MNKASTVAKWLLNLTLLFVGFVMVLSAWFALSPLVTGGGAGIMLPVSFDAQGLSIEHEVLGRGEILDSRGSVFFLEPPGGLVSIGYTLGTLLAFAPGLVLVVLLRKIMLSVSRGEPFSEANIGRIRAIGIIALAEVFRYGMQLQSHVDLTV